MAIMITHSEENRPTWPSSPSQSLARALPTGQPSSSWGDEHIQKVLQASGRQGAEQQMLLGWSPAEDDHLSKYTVYIYIYTYDYVYIYNMLFSCMKGVVGYCIILGTLVSCKPMLLSNWFSHVWRKVGAGWLSRHAVWEKHRNTWGPKMADPTTIDFYPLNNIKHYSFWMVQWFMVLVYSHLPIAMTWRKSLGGVLFDFPGFMTCSGAKVNWAARFGGANSCGGRVFQGVLGLWVFKAEDSRKPISAIGGLFQSSTLSILGTNYLDLFGLWYISKR